jgi:hypothetical protein
LSPFLGLNGVGTFFEDQKYFAAGEFGCQPRFEASAAKFNLIVWHMDEREQLNSFIASRCFRPWRWHQAFKL